MLTSIPSCWVARRQRSYYRFPAINATGRPALGRRRSQLRTRKAACFNLAALADSRLFVSIESARRFGQPRLPNPQSGNVLALNTEHLSLNTSVGRYPWPSLRRRYGPVLATLASSLTDFRVRRSDAIRAPGLAWAATSMIAAGYHGNLFLPIAKTTRTSGRPSTSSSGADVPPRFIWPRFG